MRIFIGIKLAEFVTTSIQNFLTPFMKIQSPVRWVKPQNIHLTLKFIGEVSEATYSKIEAALSESEAESIAGPDAGAFDITLRGCGKFGKGTALTIFWLGIEPSRSLTDIYHTVEHRLARIGIPKESRPFKPHITVGRNKRSFNTKPFNELIDRYREQHIVRFPVTGIQVFRSKLTPDGPIYSIIKEIPLNHAKA